MLCIWLFKRVGQVPRCRVVSDLPWKACILNFSSPDRIALGLSFAFALFLSPVPALGREVIFKGKWEVHYKALRLGQDPQQWECYQGTSEVPSTISWDKWQKLQLGAKQPRVGEQNCSSSIRVYWTGVEKAEAAEQGQYVRIRENIAGKVQAMSEATQGARSIWSGLGWALGKGRAHQK